MSIDPRARDSPLRLDLRPREIKSQMYSFFHAPSFSRNSRNGSPSAYPSMCNNNANGCGTIVGLDGSKVMPEPIQSESHKYFRIAQIVAISDIEALEV
jgi:hypothetical protein